MQGKKWVVGHSLLTPGGSCSICKKVLHPLTYSVHPFTLLSVRLSCNRLLLTPVKYLSHARSIYTSYSCAFWSHLCAFIEFGCLSWYVLLPKNSVHCCTNILGSETVDICDIDRLKLTVSSYIWRMPGFLTRMCETGATTSSPVIKTNRCIRR